CMRLEFFGESLQLIQRCFDVCAATGDQLFEHDTPLVAQFLPAWILPESYLGPLSSCSHSISQVLAKGFCIFRALVGAGTCEFTRLSPFQTSGFLLFRSGPGHKQSSTGFIFIGSVGFRSNRKTMCITSAWKRCWRHRKCYFVS